MSDNAAILPASQTPRQPLSRLPNMEWCSAVAACGNPLHRAMRAREYTAALPFQMEFPDAQQPSEKRKSRNEGQGCKREGPVGPRKNHGSREGGNSSASSRSPRRGGTEVGPTQVDQARMPAAHRSV